MFEFKEIHDASGDKIIINIKVIPGSSQSMTAGIIDGALKIKLNSPPIDGRANKECISFLSKLFKVPKTSIKIIKGERSKLKTVSINGNINELKIKLENTKK